MEEEDLSDAFSEVISPPQGFRMLYHKMLPPPARPGLAAWSPQLDLFAVVTNNDNVLLFRMNGQRVWGVAHNLGDGVHGTVLRWRPDGSSRPCFPTSWN